jgi:hypothetical protein
MAGSSTFNLLAQNAMAPSNAMTGIQAPNLAGMPGLFPGNNGTVTMTAQQQALWQQQMQFMQFQMLQMQQQQQAMQAALFQQQQQQQLPPHQQQAQQPQASTDPGGVAVSMFHQSIPLMMPMTTMAGAIGAPATGAAQTAGSVAGTLAAGGAAPGPPPSGGECGAAAALPPAPGDGDASATSYNDVPV